MRPDHNTWAEPKPAGCSNSTPQCPAIRPSRGKRTRPGEAQRLRAAPHVGEKASGRRFTNETLAATAPGRRAVSRARAAHPQQHAEAALLGVVEVVVER